MTGDLSDFRWHSSFALDDAFSGKQVVTRMKVSKDVLAKFIRAKDESKFLVHKASRALWRFSEDGQYIEPVFDEDILTEETF